jgi:hypothetical protein
VTEQRPTPGPATDAMRLRPATRHHNEAEWRRAELPSLEDEQRARLDAVLELHASTQTLKTAFCRECLTPYPCRTVRLVHGEPGTPTIEGG